MSSEDHPLPAVVLVVDDHQQVRVLLQEFLLQAGFVVLTAENGSSAEQLAANYSSAIHLLITDLEMPGMDGVCLAQRLKTQRPDMEVVYMSGSRKKLSEREGGFVTGSVRLEKPVSFDKLGSIVSGLLLRQEMPRRAGSSIL